MLKARTVVGRLDPVKSVIPADAKLASTTVTDSTQKRVVFQQENIKISETKSNNVSPDFLKQFDLTDLDEQQRKMAEDMLMSHVDSFSSSEQDIGCAEGLQLPISLSDSTPVQKTYTAIPKPLYAEVKQYLEDLLNRGWIVKSRSNYASPVVCLGKRMVV